MEQHKQDETFSIMPSSMTLEEQRLVDFLPAKLTYEKGNFELPHTTLIIPLDISFVSTVEAALEIYQVIIQKLYDSR